MTMGGHFGELWHLSQATDLSFLFAYFEEMWTRNRCAKFKEACSRFEGSTAVCLLTLKKIRKFRKLLPQNPRRGPPLPVLELKLCPWRGIVWHQNGADTPLRGGDIWVQSFNFTPKFPQNGESPGGETGTFGKLSPSTISPENCTALGPKTTKNFFFQNGAP